MPAPEADRAALEDITHPVIRSALDQALAKAQAEGVSVILDVPLLLEGNLHERCDACVFVETSRETRLARARERGWDSEELDRREAHQLSLPVKKQRCTYTIQNDGAVAATEQQVETLLRTLGAEF